MKRILLIAAILCSALMVLESCSPKGAATTIKRGNVTGNWVLNDITFEGIPEMNVKSLFGESSYKCFVGSAWKLTNSGNGSYTLGSECGGTMQSIYWSASPKEDTFQFKKIYEGEKAKNITEGYRMILASATGETMTIKTPVEYGSGTAYIVLNFNAAQK